MKEYNIDPGVGDVEEMEELFEIGRDTEEYDLFHGCIEDEDCMN